MSPRIGVSLINYKTGQLTIDCVTSALASATGLPVEIVIVDNFSNDGSAEQIADWIATLPEGAPVTLVRSEENTGFSGGHNIGIAALPQADWVFLLNSDCTVTPGFFPELHAALAGADARTGIVAPQIEDQHGEIHISNFRFHHPVSELIRGARTGAVTRIFKRWDVPLDVPANVADIGWVSFAGVALRRQMIERIGPMDEGYFLYFEDAEYCLRARHNGWKTEQALAARMIHFKGGSGPVKSLERAKKRLPGYLYESRTRFFRQAYGPLGPLAANLLFLTGRLIANLRRLLGKPAPAANAREARDIWINFTRPLAERERGRA